MVAGTVYILRVRPSYRRIIPTNYFCEFDFELRRNREYEFKIFRNFARRYDPIESIDIVI